MTQSGSQIHPNPLISFMRQPKIYIKLPSGGEFWPQGSLVIPETGEIPVYSMTAKDELMLKIPDAIMNGQAVVDVIQHCIPAIKNAWNIPSIDLDIILIAIRLATYGESMKMPLSDEFDLDYHIDLRLVMDNLMNQITWDPVVPINDELTIFVRPLNYKQISESAVKTFETQKILQIANNDSIPESDKIKAFKESFNKLTEVTIGIIEKSIYRIDSSNGSTTNAAHISEFIANADKDIFNKVQQHLEKLKDINAIKPMSIPVTDEMREKGISTDTVEVPLVFDPATFFV
jgi:hypothetical protein